MWPLLSTICRIAISVFLNRRANSSAWYRRLVAALLLVRVALRVAELVQQVQADPHLLGEVDELRVLVADGEQAAVAGLAAVLDPAGRLPLAAADHDPAFVADHLRFLPAERVGQRVGDARRRLKHDPRDLDVGENLLK